MSDEQRFRLCYSSSSSSKQADTIELEEFEEIYQKLTDPRIHYTIHQGWLKYRKNHPDGLKKTQFYACFKRWEEKKHPGRLASAPINRKPGRYLYIDWIGDQPVSVKDPACPGRTVKAHFLVFTIGYSSMTFAMAFPDGKMASVTEGINQALSYYGALPQVFRPDNMKTAVLSNTREGVVLSNGMTDIQDYYDTPVLPARPLHLKDKATVERAVLILERELLPELEGIIFETFDDLNSEIRNYIEKLNTRIKSSETLSRKELLEKFDLPKMKPLTE